MKIILSCFFFLSIISFGYTQNNLAQDVNPFIGTGGHGHTFPGATAPFGMVQLSPDTRIDGSWDGCSGYHYSDSLIYGFSHTHLSGTGVSDYGDFHLMPTYQNLKDYQPKDYASKFQHANEKASAGFYSVYLEDPKIQVELTASPRVGFHRYTFDQKGMVQFIMDFTHRDEVLEAIIEPIDSQTFKLTRRSKAWAQNQHAYAYLQFDQPVKLKVLRGEKNGASFQGKNLLVAFEYKTQKEKSLQVKLAYSMTSTEGAKLNSTEISHWNFNKVVESTQKSWNKELSKIEITTKNPTQKTIFYTALYHTMIQPNIANDLDGKYRGRDDKIHQTEGFDYYTVFSLWDTFRAAHPLYALIDKKRTQDFIQTFLLQYQQGGRLPVWELSSNETDCMIGYNAVPVIAYAMAKKIPFDYELALEASMHSSNLHWLGLDAFRKKNFIAVEDDHESVSKTLEYAYDDYCIYQMATWMGKTDIANTYLKRSHAWRNIYDPESGLMRPRVNGGWMTPFDGREVNNNYTEANSWQYSFFVPQDYDGLIRLSGGKEAFEKKLDELFTLPSKTTGRTQVDITGLIGQYAHGNEPSHHIAYLYNYIDKPEKTKYYVHKILQEFYTNTPDGLIGNEDCGQMSAWYVLSAMGIYPTIPSIPTWQATEPFFEKTIIHLENGESIKITPQTTVQELEKIDAKNFVVKPNPVIPFVETPYVMDNNMSFEKTKKIQLQAYHETDEIFYSFDSILFVKYEIPFLILESKNIYFYAIRNGMKSSVNKASYIKKPNDYSIELLTHYNPQYNAGGPQGLIDGIYGTNNWKTGHWQGYQGEPLEAIIDLKKETKISKVGISSLQDSRSWILFPSSFKVLISNDGKEFKEVYHIPLEVQPFDYSVSIKKVEMLELNVSARYVKVVVETFGALPKGHQGFGGEAFIFIDEIEIE